MIIGIRGTNTYAAAAELQRLQSEFITKFGDLALEKLDAGEGLEYPQLQAAVQSMPFLSEKKMVVVRDLGQNKTLAAELEKLCAAVAPSTDLILYETKLDKRSVYYKQFKKLTDCKEYNELDAAGHTRWLVEQAKVRGGGLTAQDANYLVERIGPSQLMLSGELDKLLLYQPVITRATIDRLTEATPHSSTFDLIDAAFSHDVGRVLHLYAEQRVMKVEPQQILALLGWQFHVLAVVKAAGNRSPDDIARASGLSPYSVRKSVGLARRITLTQIKELVRQAHELDVRLKRESIDADEALQALLLTISSL